MSLFALAPLGAIAVATVAGASLLTRRELGPVERLAMQQLSGADAAQMVILTVGTLLGLFLLVKKYWTSLVPLAIRLIYVLSLVIMFVHLLRPLLVRISQKSFMVTIPSLRWLWSKVSSCKLCKKDRKGQGGAPADLANPVAPAAPAAPVSSPDQIPVFLVDFISLALAAPVCALYWRWDNWIFSDCLAVVMAVYMIDSIRIPSLVIGTLLLLAYFVYDVYFVFFSDAMVSVAKAIDIPAKLLWPRSAGDFSVRAPTRPGDAFSMLGLGDIVIPGLVLSLLARLDRRFPSRVSLFRPALAAYALAVTTAMGVLAATQHAQPVLLYIVPYVLVATYACLGLRGRTAALDVLAYTESREQDEEPAAPLTDPGPDTPLLLTDAQQTQ